MRILRLHFDVAIYSRKYGCSRGKDKAAKEKAAAKRPKGYSIHATAAYQSGERLRDEARGITFDFRSSRSRRQDDVRHTEIIAPEGAPAWVQDRQQLYNRWEAADSRYDAQLARSIVGALPRGLTLEQQVEMVRSFVRDNLTRYGMVADTAIHTPPASDGRPNIHCHILVSMRDIEAGGFGQKNREWNLWNPQKQKAQSVDPLRDAWEAACNDALQKAGRKERVSLLSFEKEGIERTPTIHLGYKDGNAEKRGERSPKGDRNRRIRHDNQVRDQTDGLRTPPNRNPSKWGKQDRKPRHLAEIARAQRPEGSGDLRDRPQEERDEKQRIAQLALKIFRAGSQMLDKTTLRAMDQSYRQGMRRRHLEAAISRYSLLHSSKDLAQELEERKGHHHER